jgi:hypothetical protein
MPQEILAWVVTEELTVVGGHLHSLGGKLVEDSPTPIGQSKLFAAGQYQRWTIPDFKHDDPESVAKCFKQLQNNGWFSKKEVLHFSPKERWLDWDQVIARWIKLLDCPDKAKKHLKLAVGDAGLECIGGLFAESDLLKFEMSNKRFVKDFRAFKALKAKKTSAATKARSKEVDSRKNKLSQVVDNLIANTVNTPEEFTKQNIPYKAKLFTEILLENYKKLLPNNANLDNFYSPIQKQADKYLNNQEVPNCILKDMRDIGCKFSGSGGRKIKLKKYCRPAP